MPREDAITVEGQVMHILGPTLFRVVLENGHCLLGHLPRRQAALGAELKSGDRIRVELSPFDFSKGRVLIGGKEN